MTVEFAEAVKTDYDTVRFEVIQFEVSGPFEEQRARFQWAIGRVDPVTGKFERSPAPGCAGTKFYDNNAPAYTFATLISKSPTLAAAQDAVLADLEADGAIPAGTDRDYSLYPPGYVPPGP